jgi:tetratricopeptide (TPR) repeat protein
VLTTVAAYHPALHGGPIWDDFGHITFPELRSLGGLWRIWSELGATQQYYPLLHSAFWLEHRVWGDTFLGYHLINVAQHSLSAFLVVLILRRLAVPGALFAGLIFALNPVAVESVAWISEQKNTLSGVFYLASAYVYLRPPRYLRDPQSPRDARSPHYWLSFALFICALLSKTVTATLPAALLVVLWWQHGKLDWRRDVQPLVPWFVSAAIAGACTAWFERDIIGARGADFDLTLIERCLLAGRVIWFYLTKLFWPQNLTFIYPRWEIDADVWWQYLFPAGAIALAVGLAILAKRYRGPLAGYLYFCGTLVPVLGFFNVYPFRFSYVADHFQYLASLGVIVPVASALTIASVRVLPHARSLTVFVAGGVVAVLAIVTWNRTFVYQDAETLYRDTIYRNPNAWLAHQNLGMELAARNRFSEAAAAFEGALQAKPDYTEAQRNLALARMKLADAAADTPQRAAEAIAQYEAVLRADPNHFRARYNLGTLLMDVPGRQADALRHLESAVRMQPNSVEARVNLGIMLADVPSRSAEAVEHLQYALARRPELPVRELLATLQSRNENRKTTTE